MRRIADVLILTALAALAGCATSPTGDGGVDTDRTRGLELTMSVQGPDNRAIWYDVQTDGTLGFAGGMAAHRRAPSWRGAMPDSAIEALWRVIDEHGWATACPPSPDAAGDISYTVRLRTESGRRRCDFDGTTEAVAALEAVLAAAAARRLDTDLDALPRPGLQTQ